jgi:hypothetical protein
MPPVGYLQTQREKSVESDYVSKTNGLTFMEKGAVQVSLSTGVEQARLRTVEARSGISRSSMH